MKIRKLEKGLIVLLGIGIMMPLSLSFSAHYIAIPESIFILLLLFSIFWTRVRASRIKFSPPAVLLVILAFCFISLGLVSSLVALSNSNFGEVSLLHLLRWSIYALLVVILSQYLRDQEFRILFIGGMFVGVMATGVFLWIFWLLDKRYLLGIPILHLRDHESLGITLNRNTFGLYLAMGFPLGVYLYSCASTTVGRLCIMGLICFLIISTVLTFSRGAWISLALLLLIYIVYFLHTTLTRSKLIMSLTVIMVIVIGYIFSNIKDYLDVLSVWAQQIDDVTRVAFVTDSIRIIIEYPLFGVGPGNYLTAAVHLDLNPTKDPHNAFLWIGADYGLFGLIIVSGIIFFPLFYIFYIKMFTNRYFDRCELYLTFSLGCYLSVRALTTGVILSSELIWTVIALTISMASFRHHKKSAYEKTEAFNRSIWYD